MALTPNPNKSVDRTTMPLPFQTRTANTAPAAPAAPQRSYNPLAACDDAKLFESSRDPLPHGNYTVELTDIIWKQEKGLVIFEYVVIESSGPEAAPPGTKNAYKRTTRDEGWENYLAKTTLAVLGMKVSDPDANDAKRYVSAMIWAEATKQPCVASDGTEIPTGCLIGKRVEIQATVNSKGPNSKGRYYPNETWIPIQA